MAMNDNPFANLSTDQLLQMLKSGQMSNGMMAGQYTGGVGGGQDGYAGPTSTQYGVWDGQSYHPGQMNYAYDDAGKYLGSHESVDPTVNDKLAMASFAAMMAGAGMMGGFGGGSPGMSGMDLAADGGLNSINSAAAGMGGAGASGAGAVGSTVNPFAAGFTDTGTAGGAAAAGDSYSGSGALAGMSGMAAPAVAASAPAAATGGGGLLTSLASTLGVSPSMLGVGASLIGGLLGSKGVQANTTVDKSPWAPLIPYIDKQLSAGSGLLDRYMTPQYLDQADWLRNHSYEMLMPQQQSNFSRFFPGK